MPHLLIWGAKLSTADMTLQQHLYEYSTCSDASVYTCACRARPIKALYTCAQHHATQTLNTQTLTVFTHLTDASRQAIEMCGHQLNYTATHISVFTSCC